MNKIFIIFFFISSIVKGQDVIDSAKLSNELDRLAATSVGLDEELRIDVENLSLYEMIATIAEEHEINVSASPKLTQRITSNFYKLKVKEIFSFLVDRYNLNVEIVNNIIVFDEPKEEVEITPVKEKKIIDVSFNKVNQFLSIRLKNDSLPDVAQRITDVSGKNIILSPEIKTLKVSAYVLNRPIDQVIEMMAKSNNLELSIDENDFYLLKNLTTGSLSEANDQKIGSRRVSSRVRNTTNAKSNFQNGSFDLSLNDNGFVKIKALNAPIYEIIKDVAEELNLNFFMYDVPDENDRVTLVANGISFDDLLNHIFKGKEFTFKKTDDLYLVGKNITQGLRTTKLVQLENRTIETVLTSIPKSFTDNLEIKEFRDLNGFVVSGSPDQIQEFRDYIYEIDLVVPVIQIEVLIVQYQKSYDIRTGLQIGIDKETRITQGSLLPTTDVTLNASSVNNLIDAFNGLGWINLGKVTQDFYANLKAMESNSVVNISSTPKLVTLNGHTASSSIGETSYYFEQNNRLINTGITDNILQSGTYKATDANLSINITPVVSKDEHVTLDIEVEKSAFLGRVGENAPPDKSTQRFKSIVRVKNNEMVLLGGLDENEKENSGTGAPLLSRIPIVKWFFSNRTKRKEKRKLHIFIKPTVIY